MWHLTMYFFLSASVQFNYSFASTRNVQWVDKTKTRRTDYLDFRSDVAYRKAKNVLHCCVIFNFAVILAFKIFSLFLVLAAGYACLTKLVQRCDVRWEQLWETAWLRRKLEFFRSFELKPCRRCDFYFVFPSLEITLLLGGIVRQNSFETEKKAYLKLHSIFNFFWSFTFYWENKLFSLTMQNLLELFYRIVVYFIFPSLLLFTFRSVRLSIRRGYVLFFFISVQRDSHLLSGDTLGKS